MPGTQSPTREKNHPEGGQGRSRPADRTGRPARRLGSPDRVREVGRPRRGRAPGGHDRGILRRLRDDLSDLPTVIDFDAGSLVLTTFGRSNAATVRGDQEIADRYLNLFFRI
jgi:hypothetical protein